MNKEPTSSIIGSELSVAQALQRIRQRLRTILIWAVLAAFVAGIACTVILPRKYTAQTTLLFTAASTSPRVASGVSQMLAGELASQLGAPSGFSQVRAVLNSRMVRDNLIEKLQLKNYFGVETDGQARQILASRTQIQSNIVQYRVNISVTTTGTSWITDRSPNADWVHKSMAAAIANGYTEQLEEVQTRFLRRAARARREFLDRRVAEAQHALSKAEEDLRDWQETSGVVVPATIASAVTNKLVDLRVDRERAIIETEAAQHKLNTAKEQLQAVDQTREASRVTARNPLINTLERRLAEAQTQLALQTQVEGKSEKHPDVRRYQTQIESITADLRQALEKELVTQERTEAISPAYDQLIGEILQARLRIAWSKARVTALEAAIERVVGEISQMPEAQTEHARKSRAVTIKEQIYELLRMEYEQAAIDEHRDSTAFVVLDPAIPPEHKSSPHIRTSTVAAFAAGLLFAILYALIIPIPSELATDS